MALKVLIVAVVMEASDDGGGWSGSSFRPGRGPKRMGFVGLCSVPFPNLAKRRSISTQISLTRMPAKQALTIVPSLACFFAAAYAMRAELDAVARHFILPPTAAFERPARPIATCLGGEKPTIREMRKGPLELSSCHE
jgi:hypothetical protein